MRARLLARIPIRLRLSLAFSLAMAVVLAATGLFLYLRLDSALGGTIDDSLRARADDVAALVRRGDSGLDEGERPSEGEEEDIESFAQVLDSSGRVVDATPPLQDRPLLEGDELARALSGRFFFDRASVPPSDDPFRLLAAPVFTERGERVVVVGTSSEDHHEALDQLLGLLLLGGPAALLVASGLGYALASAAFRPVEAMRREAEAISGSEPGRRLTVPPARDEVARLGETLNEMLARLESVLARERRFVSDASHELRTPLSLLKTELELALRHARSVEELEQALRSAAEETDRLTQLAEDLLVLARADQGRLPVRRERVEARGVLELVAERFASRAARSGREIELDEGSDVELDADHLRLEQAVGNLVENALRHGDGRVVLSAEERDGFVELHVRDEGSGFSAAFLPRAFERFSRSDETRSRGGAGLGLAIACVIARAHGGDAHAENRASGGADVWLALPRRRN